MLYAFTNSLERAMGFIDGKGVKHAERVKLFHHGCSAPARTEMNHGCCPLLLLGSVEVTFLLRESLLIFSNDS